MGDSFNPDPRIVDVDPDVEDPGVMEVGLKVEW